MMTSRVQRDQGFTLLEVVVAMVVFAMLASFVLSMVLTLGGAARNNDVRIVAAGVLNQQIESVRGLPVAEIPDGLVTSTVQVGNNSFTVEQTSKLVGTDSTVSLCDVQSGKLSYRLVTVNVAWSGMGNIQPARADTLKVIGTGDLQAGQGTAAIGVQDAKGAPVAGALITLTPGSVQATTGADGCAVFASLAEGRYTARATKSGYVNPSGAATATSTVTVISQDMTRSELLLASAAVIPVSLETATGFAALGTYPVEIRSSYVTPSVLPTTCSVSRLCLSGLPGQVRNVFPGQYTMWLGACRDSMSSTSWVTTSAPAGGTATAVTLPMAKVVVVVTKQGRPTAGRAVTVSHPADAAGTGAPSCGSAVNYSTTSALPGRKLLMPYGTWTFSSTGTGTTGTTTVALRAGTNTVYVGT